MQFKLTSEFQPTGDQPEAIEQLSQGVLRNTESQVLQGVTGSGKTFTIANVINRINRPTLILSHNKTLAAQLYGEFKTFFPENAVEYFVSYYDYYQPEAYLPTTDTYIEKDLAINEEIDKLRLRTTASLLSGRKEFIVVSSVSCLYGMADPRAFGSNVIHLTKGMKINRNQLLRRLVDALYANHELEFKRGCFRAKGETVDIFPAIETFDGLAYRIEFWDNEIDRIHSFDPTSGRSIAEFDDLDIYPANLFVTDKATVAHAIIEIEKDMHLQVAYLKEIGKLLESKRLEERVRYDLEMIRELGYCPGIENYSRYFDGRAAGVRPFCLLDYFPEDFLMVIDESHVTVPQIRAMYGGDHARKQTLIEYGFRLPAAFDNRPLTFEEFENKIDQILFVSATPGQYEAEHELLRAEQIIRPTGLLDPKVEVRPVEGQIDDLIGEVNKEVEKGNKILITTLTKRMAEDLTDYMKEIGIRVRYLHSDIDTLERTEIIRDMRLNVFDVLVGINLLREGLDIPEITLVAILDADKEGFLRSETSLVQTIGRAARNVDGHVIMYADVMTDSMKAAIEETERRRTIQEKYNKEHNITPRSIKKAVRDLISISKNVEKEAEPEKDPESMNCKELESEIAKTQKQMKKAAAELDFEKAAELRDRMIMLKKHLQETEE